MQESEPREPDSGRDQCPEWLHELDHTGDAGFELTAPDLETLFERAAQVLFDFLCNREAVRPETTRSFVLQDSDSEALLVRWLNELNYHHLTQHHLFCRFKIRLEEDGHLHAEVFGEPIDPLRHTVYTEVKAVTYHGLSVRKMKASWQATVIFDL